VIYDLKRKKWLIGPTSPVLVTWPTQAIGFS